MKHHLFFYVLGDSILQDLLAKKITHLNIDVLYSLVDVNERFDQLVFDPLYIHNLDMTIKSLSDDTSLIHDEILERICEKILPRIHDEVNKISVEPNSIKRILHAVNYPRLYTLSLINFEEEILLHYLTGMLFNFDRFN